MSSESRYDPAGGVDGQVKNVGWGAGPLKGVRRLSPKRDLGVPGQGVKLSEVENSLDLCQCQEHPLAKVEWTVDMSIHPVHPMTTPMAPAQDNITLVRPYSPFSSKIRNGLAEP